MQEPPLRTHKYHFLLSDDFLNLALQVLQASPNCCGQIRVTTPLLNTPPLAIGSGWGSEGWGWG